MNNRFIKEGFFIVLVSLVASGISALVHPKAPPWYQVNDPLEKKWSLSVEKANQLISRGKVIFIDARVRSDYNKGHVNGAILLNKYEWEDLFFKHFNFLKKAISDNIIVYCGTSKCGKSKQIAKKIRELVGNTNVYVLKGDWNKLKQTNK